MVFHFVHVATDCFSSSSSNIPLGLQYSAKCSGILMNFVTFWRSWLGVSCHIFFLSFAIAYENLKLLTSSCTLHTFYSVLRYIFSTLYCYYLIIIMVFIHEVGNPFNLFFSESECLLWFCTITFCLQTLDYPRRQRFLFFRCIGVFQMLRF